MGMCNAEGLNLRMDRTHVEEVLVAELGKYGYRRGHFLQARLGKSGDESS